MACHVRVSDNFQKLGILNEDMAGHVPTVRAQLFVIASSQLNRSSPRAPYFD